MHDVDPKHFRKRFVAAVDAVFAAAEAQVAANLQMGEAIVKLKLIAGRGYADATFEMATEPRAVCQCGHEFQKSVTNRDICVDCIRLEREQELRSE